MIVDGLNDDEQATLTELWKVWTSKLKRNLTRAVYYDHKNVLEDLGIAIPPHLTDIALVLGWPSKAVDVLARRCKLERFVTPGTDDDPLDIRGLWRGNDMDIELPQTLSSSLLHSCAFMSATPGMAGEPDVLISSQSALYGSGLWNHRLRRLKAALSIMEFNDLGLVQQFVFFIPGRTIRCIRSGNSWNIERFDNRLDRLPVEVLPYKPRLDRPFGSSRINRTVMGLTDSALRTLFRMEISAEFYSSPQRWIMGADESMFVDEAGNPKSQWEAILGRVWAAGRDEDGEVPSVGQFNASSQQPHIEQIRSLAAVFASETSLPLRALGIVQDNPSSAEAMESEERDLIIEARYAMDCYGPRIVRLMQTALQIRDGWDEMPPEVADLDVRWSDPSNPPASASADAVVKLLGVMPALANSRVPLEMMDWDEATIDRAMSDMRRANTVAVMNQLMAQGNGGNTAGTPTPAGSDQPASQQ